MNTNQAQSSIQKVNSEIFSLTPSTLITLFEIDVTDILFESGFLNAEGVESTNNIFRFHNNPKLLNGSIIWQDKEYFPAPIRAEGFELTTNGTLPIPKLSITVNEEGISLLAILRDKISMLGDLVGAKVTRIRTFAKFLDGANFQNFNQPKGFAPDPYAELPRDIYFIDRKSTENKNFTEYELSSVFDLQGIKLPMRVVYAEVCSHTYRGEGCLYEYADRKNEDIHGDAELPTIAPAIATSNDEEIYTILGFVRKEQIINRGAWSLNTTYLKGEQVYIEKGGIKYYFVAKINNPNVGPPNLNYWIPDQCSKRVKGCKLRWLNLVNSQKPSELSGNTLPFGGFLAANKV